MINRIEEQQREGLAGELIATFGDARLVRVNGRIHLRGGSMSDRMEALEWLSLFMPEATASVRN
jgi:hypothetical protein